jgi:putative aldouronate transport system permease protein
MNSRYNSRYNSLMEKGMDKINIIIMILSLIVFLYPLYYVLIYSISDPSLSKASMFILPVGFSLEVYKSVFKLANLGNAFLMSALRTVLGTAITLFCSSLLAFMVTQKYFVIRKFVYRFLVITMYFNAGLIPWYLNMVNLGLKNSFLVYILPTAMNAFYVILIKTFIELLPKALEESAQLDGAGFFKVFSRIIFPMCGPIIATIALFSAVGQWNSWMDTYFFVTNQKLFTLQYVLYKFLSEAEALNDAMRNSNALLGHTAVAMTPESLKMGVTMVVTIPILIVYPSLQKYFVKGVALGSVKG